MDRTHLELDSNFTDSLTCWRFFGAGSLLPPDAAAKEMPTVLSSVPMTRYSVLMARPRMVLRVVSFSVSQDSQMAY